MRVASACTVVAVALVSSAAEAFARDPASRLHGAAPAPAGLRAAVAEAAARAPELLSEYIRVDTTNPPGNETEGARFLATVLAAEGIEARILESEPGRGSLYARLPGKGGKKAVALLSHIDVVPADASEWTHPPYAGAVVDGVVYGRGALDCKGVGIAQLLALVALKRSAVAFERDVVLLATADEEMGGKLGAGWLVDNHFDLVADVEFVLNEGGFIHREPGMPLIFNLNAAEKAPCWFRVGAQGEAGHASRPPRETSVTILVAALHRLVTWGLPLEVVPTVAGYYRAYAKLDPRNAEHYLDLERSLREDEEFRRMFLNDPGAAALVRDTVTPTVLSGSPKTNVVPGTAWAEVDSRLLPGHDCSRFLDAVRQRIGDERVTVEPAGVAFPATASPIDNDLRAAVERAAGEEKHAAVVLPGLLAGFTDSHWFRERGVAAYGFAPIEVSAAQRQAIHGPNESVDADALVQSVERYVTILEELSR
jgi:acetylornithine deacetylase/succinyl-diaminopimelate desuccinylase-like protein